MKYDVAIIGGGIIGALVARELTRYELSVCVLDKGSDIAENVTKGNCAILYPGYHYPANSLKRRACVEGNRMHHELAKELGVPVKTTGSLFVAFDEDGMCVVREKYEQGLEGVGEPGPMGKAENAISDLRMLSAEEVRELEPNISEKVIGGMLAPSTGIISPFKLAIAAVENAAHNGAQFFFDTKVTAVLQQKDSYILKTQKGDFESRFVVNTAGDEASIVEGLVRERELESVPVSGQFLVFDSPSPINHVIFVANSKREAGTHLVPTVNGQMLAGPVSQFGKAVKNAEDAGLHDLPAAKRTETTREGIDRILATAQKLLPGLDESQIITNFAVMRTNVNGELEQEQDFFIRESAPRFISALGIKNPGLTASPYLAKVIVSELEKAGLKLVDNKRFNPTYRSRPTFLSASKQEQAEMLAENPAYGRVICKCEGITEGDVLNVLNSAFPPRTINSLKKRLRVTMGSCQGSFCIPEIIEVLSKAWGVEPEKILKGKAGSNFVKGRVRK